MTDDNGYFELPAVFDQSFLGKFLPGEFAIPQQVFVTYGGEEYKVWAGVKRTKDENSEARGNELVVQCKLDSEPQAIAVDRGFYYTQCSWGVETDED